MPDKAKDGQRGDQQSSLLQKRVQHPPIPVRHDVDVLDLPGPSIFPGATKRLGCREKERSKPASAPNADRGPENSTAMPQPTDSRVTQVPQESNSPVLQPHSTTKQFKPGVSTIITRTIEEIEDLLKEALNIAQVATEEHEAGAPVRNAELPSLVGNGPGGDSRTLTAELASHPVMETFLPADEEHLAPACQYAEAKSSQSSDRQGSFVTPETHLRGQTGAQSSAAELRTLHHDWAQSSLRQRSQHFHRPETDRKSLPASDSFRESTKPAPSRDLRLRSSQELFHLKSGSRNVSRKTRPKIMPRLASKRPRYFKQHGPEMPAAWKNETTTGQKEAASVNDEQSSSRLKNHSGSPFKEMFCLESGHESSHENFAQRQPRHIGPKESKVVDMGELRPIDMHETWKHRPVARDWTISRKRFAASIACTNATLIGVIIGIYAGEVPAIQYMVADLEHHIILGNVFFYIGLAIPTLFFWPLPLMHGRKPYTIIALTIALCLQIPQGIAVSDYRPVRSIYRSLLLASRGLSGLSLGFVSINLQATLLDLFGASLQSSDPYDEIIDAYDFRRHGGGMGLWLGIWTLCSIGSISLGFFIGTLVVSGGVVSWGFWTSLLLMMVVLLLNIIGPEVRRSAYRRTVAKVMGEEGNVRRISHGEIEMHMKSAGPYWWGEEVKAGVVLCWKMLQQPGFAVAAMYTAWVYAHFTLVLMLLGALASRYYRLKPVQVGICVLSLGIGALLATPFQKASFFSRARRHRQRTDSMTLQNSFAWSSHLLRRAMFTLLLPFAGLAYALASKGPTMPVAVPTFFAACVGFLSNLAIAECQGIIMEAFDTSDLQPGMTGRPNRHRASRDCNQRTNFSCYPRISAGFAVIQSLSFSFASVATGVCGGIERQLGTRQASGIVAGLLMGLTLLLTVVLFRFRVVRMIPDALPTTEYMIRSNTSWEPVILGRPSGTMRKISILESGSLTRWYEIRRRNRLTPRNNH